MSKYMMLKLQETKGFTLVEALASLLVITMLFTVVATGVPVASQVYNDVVASSNAQALLSTGAMRLREELSLSTMADPSHEGTVSTYIKGDYEGSNYSTAKLAVGAFSDSKVGSGIIVQTEVGKHGSGNWERRLLVTEGDAPDRLYLSFDEINYEDGIFTVENLKVQQRAGDAINTNGDRTLAEIPRLEIRSLPTLLNTP